MRVIADANEFLEIEDVWNALINKCSENPIFLSGFVEQFIESYCSKGWAPLVLVISANKMTLGAAPLMTEKKFGIRFVRFLSKSWFSPDFIFDDQYRVTCIEHTLHFLFKTLRCQFVDLTLPAESPNLPILEKKCKANGIYFCAKLGSWADMGHCIIPVRHLWDDFEKLRGYNFRRRFKRLKRNLDQAGSWRVTCTEKGNEGSDVFERILDVERMSWKEAERTRSGTQVDPDLSIFWRGAQYTSRTESDFNWRVWFLELNDQTLAYSMVLEYKETAFIVKTSYDERYKRLQPGIYINNVAIRELFEKGKVRKIDWLTDLPFHRNWTSLCLPRVRVTMSRKGILSHIMAHVMASEYTRNISSNIPEPLLKKTPLISEL